MKKVSVYALVLLSFIGLTGYWGTGVVYSADKMEIPVGKVDLSKAPERGVDPHVGYYRFFFQDEKMDYIFGSLAAVQHELSPASTKMTW